METALSHWLLPPPTIASLGRLTNGHVDARLSSLFWGIAQQSCFQMAKAGVMAEKQGLHRSPGQERPGPAGQSVTLGLGSADPGSVWPHCLPALLRGQGWEGTGSCSGSGRQRRRLPTPQVGTANVSNALGPFPELLCVPWEQGTSPLPLLSGGRTGNAGANGVQSLGLLIQAAEALLTHCRASPSRKTAEKQERRQGAFAGAVLMAPHPPPRADSASFQGEPVQPCGGDPGCLLVSGNRFWTIPALVPITHKSVSCSPRLGVRSLWISCELVLSTPEVHQPRSRV